MDDRDARRSRLEAKLADRAYRQALANAVTQLAGEFGLPVSMDDA